MAPVDGTAQKIQSKPVRKQVQNVRSDRSRPLAGKSFFLDLPSGKTLEFLEKSVKRFGGVVESFLSKEVTCIVSNNQDARKESWGRRKQSAAVLRNAQAGTQPSGGLGRAHRDPSYKSTDAFLVTRGRALLQKAIGAQSNACGGGGSVLASARSWGIEIMHTDDMFSYLQRLGSKRCRFTRQMKPIPSGPQSALKVTRLQSPFLKVEDESRRFRPFLQQFKNFPELCFPKQRRCSPFDPPRSPACSKTPEEQPAHSSGSPACSLVPKRQRGYCECCEETFVDLQMHLRGPRHTAFALDASHYAPVDSLVSHMTSAFAEASSSPPLPPRVPPAPSGDHPGLQEDVLQRILATSGRPQQSCPSGESSGGRPVSLGSLTPLPEEDQAPQRQWTELFGEVGDTPSELLPSLSLGALPGQAGDSSSGAEHCGGEVGAEAGSWAASQQKVWAPPALLPPQPRKRKLLHSPRGQVQKRPTLTRQPLSQPPPDTNALPGIPPVGTTERSFPQEDGSQAGTGPPWLPVVPVAHHGLCAPPTRSPQEGLQQPAQQLKQKAGPAVRPSEERHTQAPCVSPGVGAQPCSPGTGPSQCTEAAGAAWPGLGLPPLSGSEESSSSQSEWDGPLLRALEGTSHSPPERPIDSALLGTCVSLRGSGYESHLCSVLWQALEPHEAHQGDSCHGHREGLRTPFNPLPSVFS